MMSSIRKRRRDRTLSRLANQKRLDKIAQDTIGKSMMDSMATWSATVCPECNKELPSRAFIEGYDLECSLGEEAIKANTTNLIVTVGCDVHPQYCHQDKSRCAGESAKANREYWLLSNMYAFQENEKSIEKRVKQSEYLMSKWKEKHGEH